MLKIGLAPYKFINNDISFNIAQIENAMNSAQNKVDLLCFGESFLQGFDALHWNYEYDKQIAISVDSTIMLQLCQMTLQYHVDLLLGYIEISNESIYSSCAVIENGQLIHNYRRISRGWKKCRLADEHYKEGIHTPGFLYHGQHLGIALCGDLWDFPERFKSNSPLIWPVYVDFTPDEWSQYEIEYAEQARLAARQTLMINSISEIPKSYGGAFHFVDGTRKERTVYGKEEILIVQL